MVYLNVVPEVSHRVKQVGMYVLLVLGDEVDSTIGNHVVLNNGILVEIKNICMGGKGIILVVVDVIVCKVAIKVFVRDSFIVDLTTDPIDIYSEVIDCFTIHLDVDVMDVVIVYYIAIVAKI